MTPSRRMRRTGRIGGEPRDARDELLRWTRTRCTETPGDQIFQAVRRGRLERLRRNPDRPDEAGVEEVFFRRLFDGLFLTVLCTIQLLSEESLALPIGGANVFWGCARFAAIRTQFAATACGAFARITRGNLIASAEGTCLPRLRVVPARCIHGDRRAVNSPDDREKRTPTYGTPKPLSDRIT
jgi:hypothetical protein